MKDRHQAVGWALVPARQLGGGGARAGRVINRYQFSAPL